MTADAPQHDRYTNSSHWYIKASWPCDKPDIHFCHATKLGLDSRANFDPSNYALHYTASCERTSELKTAY
jgi:hypothetical protein